MGIPFAYIIITTYLYLFTQFFIFFQLKSYLLKIMPKSVSRVNKFDFFQIQYISKMESKLLKLILIFSISHAFLSLNIDPNDVLAGAGLFTTQSHQQFTLDASHTTSFLTSANNTNIIRLEKPAGQSVQYSKGLLYQFNQSKPAHIQFKFASTNPDTEDSNFRLMDSSGNTVVLFRAGKGGLIRVNQQQMISFYNSSLSTDADIRMTQIDLKLDWNNSRIDIFVNSTYKQNCKFFNSTVEKVSQILLYNLYESVSYWQEIVVCTNICYGFNYELIGKWAAFTLIILILY